MREEQLRSITLQAGIDLSSAQYSLVELDANGNAVVATAGARAIGVVQNDPILGEAATVGFSGIGPVKVGATFTAPGPAMSNGTGQAIPYVPATTGANPFIVGDVMTVANAVGEIVPMLIAR